LSSSASASNFFSFEFSTSSFLSRLASETVSPRAGTALTCAERRHFATMLQNGVVTSLPRGALGMIVIRLKPEAAVRLVGERPRYFLDAGIGLDGALRCQPGIHAAGAACGGDHQR
jgi:hypothetical protein